MYFSSVPLFLRNILPSNLEWEGNSEDKSLYLTFDDGPIPIITQWVLDILDEYHIKATFFCVGENVGRYPEVYSEVIERGHVTGNHTFNHLQAWKNSSSRYLENVEKCRKLVDSKLFRPPHGQITPSLARTLGENYRLIMWSVLSRDFDQSLSGYKCLRNTINQTSAGNIIVFHDSIKAWKRLEYALPRYIEDCLKQGYNFKTL